MLTKSFIFCFSRIFFLSFCITSLPTIAQSHLTNGNSVSGVITNSSDEDRFTIDLQVGERVYLSVADLSDNSFRPWIRAINPLGQQEIGGNGTSGRQVAFNNFTASVAGIHEIIVGDSFGLRNSDIGNYELHSAWSGASELGTLENDIEFNGSLTVGDIDSFAISLNAGDKIFTHVADVNQGELWPAFIIFENSTGIRLISDDHPLVASNQTVVTQNGDYTLLVFGDRASSGDYEVFLAKAPGANELGSLNPEAVFNTDLSLGDIDTFSVNLSLGSDLHVEVTGVELFPRFEVFKPNGEFWFAGAGRDGAVSSNTAPADTSGLYSIVLYSDSNGAPTRVGDYSIVANFDQLANADIEAVDEEVPLPAWALICLGAVMIRVWHFINKRSLN